MGASYAECEYEKCSVTALEEHVENDCDEGYFSSKKGFSRPKKSFTSKTKATDWIQEYSDNHGPLLAVKVFFSPTCSTSTRLDRKIDTVQGKLHTLLIEEGSRLPDTGNSIRPLMEGVLARVKNTKSQ